MNPWMKRGHFESKSGDRMKEADRYQQAFSHPFTDWKGDESL